MSRGGGGGGGGGTITIAPLLLGARSSLLPTVVAPIPEAEESSTPTPLLSPLAIPKLDVDSEAAIDNIVLLAPSPRHVRSHSYHVRSHSRSNSYASSSAAMSMSASASRVVTVSKVPELADVAQRVTAEAERTAREVTAFVAQVQRKLLRAEGGEDIADADATHTNDPAETDEQANVNHAATATNSDEAKQTTTAPEFEEAAAAVTADSPTKSPASTAATLTARRPHRTVVVPFGSASAARGPIARVDKDAEPLGGGVTSSTFARGDDAPANNDRAEIMQPHDPLIKAAKCGQWEDVLMLIQTSSGDSVRARAAYVNRRDRNGSSALFHCVWHGHFKVLEVLLYHGADPNVQNNRMNTALHLCTEKGHRKLIRLLIEMGADITLKNWQNKTCLDVIPSDEESSGATPGDGLTLGAVPRQSHQAGAAENLKAFVAECAAEAQRRRDQEREESGNSGLGQVQVSAAPGAAAVVVPLVSAVGSNSSFAEFSHKRDAALAAASAHSAASRGLRALLDPSGRPVIDLWELTAEDRRGAGIRGNFFGSDRAAADTDHAGSAAGGGGGGGGASSSGGGLVQSKTLSGQLLIHSAASMSASANANAMGAYKAQYAQATSATGAATAEMRARLVAALVREELAHHSLSELWGRTRAAVGARQTVVASSDDLLKQEASRMQALRDSMQQRAEGIPLSPKNTKQAAVAAADATKAHA